MMMMMMMVRRSYESTHLLSLPSAVDFSWLLLETQWMLARWRSCLMKAFVVPWDEYSLMDALMSSLCA